MIKITRPDCPNEKSLQNDYKNKENKEALKNASFGKCMYCESIISHISFGDVEHIKPKSVYKDLEFDWNNLGYSCQKCNNKKREKYNESIPFINPYEENPSDFIEANGALILSKDNNDRGNITIKDIGIDRPELLEKRGEILCFLEKIIKESKKHIQDEGVFKEYMLKIFEDYTKDSSEYSLTVKSFLKSKNLL